MSSSASPLHHILAAMAGDAYWSTSGSTRGPASEIPDRTPTRTASPAPYNLTLLALQQDHDRNLRDFVAEHGGTGPATEGVSVYAAAGIIAAARPDAAEDKAVVDLADRLQANIAIGEGLTAIGAITCPSCGCWSLLPARGTTGWRAACHRSHCRTPEGPRTWSLRAIARHHLRDPRAA